MYRFQVKIADVVFGINAQYAETQAYFADFLSAETVNETIDVLQSDIAEIMEKYNDFSEEMSERAVVKYKMDKCLAEYGAFPLHATSLSYNGYAYIFTAASGVGKSTHAKRWREAFGSNVVMINDDRPYLKVTQDGIFAYSHPQAGKHKIYSNTSAQVRLIGKIIRDPENYVVRVPKTVFFPYLVQQSFTMDEPQITEKIIKLIIQVVNRVDFAEIHCNQDIDAACQINRKINEQFHYE